MNRRAIQVVDLGFGDSGKGSMVDYLAWTNQAEWIVRFNGGPQAGHNVVLSDGRHHCFAQFGSGSLQAGPRTLLSRFMLIDPYALLNEAAHLAELGAEDVMGRTFIDEGCLVITPPQQVANRVRERARGKDAHGTCGMGVGECVEDAARNPEFSVLAKDLHDPALLKKKLRAQLDLKCLELKELLSHASRQDLLVLTQRNWIETAIAVYREVAGRVNIISSAQTSEILRESACTIFEGAQGVLLDERFGFHPHTTWSKTTFTNADVLLDETKSDTVRTRLGVMRAYMTRHGNGPLVSEHEQLNIGWSEPHNRDDGWPGRFRRGVLDLNMLRYAIEACGGVDAIALTCVDHLPKLPAICCDSYEVNGHKFLPTLSEDLIQTTKLTRALAGAAAKYRHWPVDSPRKFIAALQSELHVPVAYESHGMMREQKLTVTSAP